MDEQVRGLIERYGDELTTYMAQARVNGVVHTGRRNGKPRTYRSSQRADAFTVEPDGMADLRARVNAMEAQQATVEAILAGFQMKVRPLALALGSCPECFVGIDGCPRCSGLSRVGQNAPDVELLQTLIVAPLAERGVPLALNKP